LVRFIFTLTKTGVGCGGVRLGVVRSGEVRFGMV